MRTIMSHFDFCLPMSRLDIVKTCFASALTAPLVQRSIKLLIKLVVLKHYPNLCRTFGADFEHPTFRDRGEATGMVNIFICIFWRPPPAVFLSFC